MASMGFEASSLCRRGPIQRGHHCAHSPGLRWKTHIFVGSTAGFSPGVSDHSPFLHWSFHTSHPLTDISGHRTTTDLPSWQYRRPTEYWNMMSQQHLRKRRWADFVFLFKCFSLKIKQNVATERVLNYFPGLLNTCQFHFCGLENGEILILLFCFNISFIFREGEGGRKREGETSMCGCLSHTPHWEPGPQPRHVPWLGIEPATHWLTGWHSIHWATPARADSTIFDLDLTYFLRSVDNDDSKTPNGSSSNKSKPLMRNQRFGVYFVLCLWLSEPSLFSPIKQEEMNMKTPETTSKCIYFNLSNIIL